MTLPNTPQGALSHLKVLDLSRVLAGPWCTQMLADMGADVVKVERPVAGDDTRHWGPPFMPGADGRPTQDATYFTACNRNKRSITIDMAKEEGQALIRQMAVRSDILVENFKVGGLAHYGLDYASLKALNPRLIYCSITGFGQTGPYAERAGYDLMIQAMSGMMSITGRADGEPGGGPQRAGVAITDVFTGIYATSAILAAVEMRHRTGEGQHIDMALLDVGMAILANQAAGFINTGAEPQRMGNAHPSLVPYQDFPTLDGAMLLAIGNDGQFARFCQAAGRLEWAQDPRFTTNPRRVENRSTLIPLMMEVTRTRSTDAWIALLEDKAVPCGPINTLARAFADPQVQARGLVQNQRVARVEYAQAAPETIANASYESIRTVASPIRLSAAPVQLRYPPPALGEHTQVVLTELGLDAGQIQDLQARGIV
ncbi:CaiB/BaiF CoA transferase family protein [Rhodoferax mekongensis]|uniref:CaiB/BaiF CoA-transferase family protein n=1 Tax=Rhodoferax mekongensis TaxID=3068341 RepID=A0ABZ0B026_9BURK|nr:CaiB/BaiF CoA-transferase family protein [Rhodoferax sp. TBRC 17307]WNO05263.1 CaiB/BaiF CoA-transferase family protein [Rhodoferax sp. TBRC 17307]